LRCKNDSDDGDDDDDGDNIDIDDVPTAAQPVASTRRATRKKPVLQFSSDDNDDFEESTSKGCFVAVFHYCYDMDVRF